MATPVWLSRYLELMKGKRLPRLWAQARTLQAMGKVPKYQARITPDVIERALDSAGLETAKVIGSHVATGAGVGGLAYGATSLADPNNPLRSAFAKSRTGKLLEHLGIKVAAENEDIARIAGGTAGIGVSAKAISDIRRPMSFVNQGLDTAAKLNARPYSLRSGIDALNAYADIGHSALNTRVLGMPLPYWGTRHGNPFFTGRYAGLIKSLGRDPANLSFVPSTLAKTLKNYFERGMGNLGFPPYPEMGHSGLFKVVQKLDNAGWQPGSATDDILRNIRGSQEHYRIFARGKQPQITKHLIDEILGELPDAAKNGLGSNVWNIIKNPNAEGTATYIGSLVRAAPTPAAKKSILDAVRAAAERNMLGGSARIRGYGNIARVSGKAIKGLGAVGAAASLIPIINGIRNIKQSAVSRDQLISGAGVAAGSGAAGYGVRTLARPLDVGVTWGEVPSIGEGHKTPGRTLFDMLKSRSGNPDMGNFRITQAVRGTNGSIPAMQPSTYKGVDKMRGVLGRKFDVMFDTGMGAGIPGFWLNDGGNQMNPLRRLWYNLNKPTSHLGGHVGYMTDIAHGMAGGDSASMGRYTRGSGIGAWMRRTFAPGILKDTDLIYGPSNLTQNNPLNIAMRTSTLSTPLLPAKNLSNIMQGGNKSEIISELLSDPATQLGKRSRELLSTLPESGKRVMVISGSGRGDQVALKAMRTQAMLKRMGLADKVQVVALLGGNAKLSPLASIIQGHPDIISVGFVKKPGLFSRLPMLGDLHWGSTGTMSLYESLASPVPFAQTRSSNRWRDIEHRFLNSAKGRALMEQHGIANTPQGFKDALRKISIVDLDRWNHGNKELARRLGAIDIDTPADAIRAIMGQTPKDFTRARSRAGAMQQSLIQSRDKLSGEFLPRILRRARMLKGVRGAGLVGLGATAAGVGIHRFRKKGEAMNKLAGIRLPNILSNYWNNLMGKSVLAARQAVQANQQQMQNAQRRAAQFSKRRARAFSLNESLGSRAEEGIYAAHKDLKGNRFYQRAKTVVDDYRRRGGLGTPAEHERFLFEKELPLRNAEARHGLVRNRHRAVISELAKRHQAALADSTKFYGQQGQLTGAVDAARKQRDLTRGLTAAGVGGTGVLGTFGARNLVNEA